MDDFNFAINRFILININGNKSQKSWEQIARTFSVQASCADGRKEVHNMDCFDCFEQLSERAN